MTSDLVPQLPKVSLKLRSAAFIIDLAIAWLVSVIISPHWFGQSFVFGLTWMGIRVFLVVKNKGQSLGRYALDMRVWDTKWQRTPMIQDLVKREGILALCSILAIQGLTGLTSRNAAVLILILPLIFDWLVALTDLSRHKRAFHDQIAQTIVIGTTRGYSLDIKIKLLIDKVKNKSWH